MRHSDDLPDRATLEAAIARLEPDLRPRWGRMSAPQMVEHCARFNELYLGRRKAAWPTRLLARLLGRRFMRKSLATSPFAVRHNQATLPSLRIRSTPPPGDFEVSRSRLRASLAEIESLTGRWAHPLYGAIDAAAGRALARHHLAHHLHQFGVLEPPASG